ncbi:MAG: glycoside hydrolase [Actinomycetota bacterium]|nr:glycoside hydrolase [Actinomycetota bacterium]
MVMIVNIIPNSLSGETNQDSEPSLAVNPANPLQIAASAFTPDPMGGPNAPIYVSTDGGRTWTLNSIVPSDAGRATGDISPHFSSTTNNLYAGILRRPGRLRLNALRTSNFLQPTRMAVLEDRTGADQPWTQATTVPSGEDAGKDRLYIGNNDLGAPGDRSATIDQSLDAGISNPTFDSIRIERRSTGTAGQDGPQIRPVVHADGTIYAVFYRWRTFNRITNLVTADVVVVRDDDWGAGSNPFAALVDGGDNIAGVRIVRGIRFTWDASLGQQRLGGDLSIAVDPNNSSTVYLAWADQRIGGYTLHVRRSTDRGATWSSDLLAITNAMNPALAINSASEVGFLYQRVTGTGANQRWETHLRRTMDGRTWNDLLLATTPATTPAPQFHPYLGDYVYLMAVERTFYGIFSANNTPDLGNFPNGVSYQRNANFATRRLFARDGVTRVPASIDPFFFRVP